MKKEALVRTCPGCGRNFHPNNGKHKWCTASCQAIHWREKHGSRLNTTFVDKLGLDTRGVNAAVAEELSKPLIDRLGLKPNMDLNLKTPQDIASAVVTPDMLEHSKVHSDRVAHAKEVAETMKSRQDLLLKGDEGVNKYLKGENK